MLMAASCTHLVQILEPFDIFQIPFHMLLFVAVDFSMVLIGVSIVHLVITDIAIGQLWFSLIFHRFAATILASWQKYSGRFRSGQ